MKNIEKLRLVFSAHQHQTFYATGDQTLCLSQLFFCRIIGARNKQGITFFLQPTLKSLNTFRKYRVV